jgi:uncharacterized cupredoxin-like copper-binding protein
MSRMKLVPIAAVAAFGLLPIRAVAQSDQPTVIPVELSEFKFAPAEIVLTKGQHYVLRLTDGGKHDHNLSAKAFFQTVTLAADSVNAVHDGAVDLTPGVVADVGFVPQTAGTYEMHCTHPFHATFGMKGHIVVR